MNIQKILNCINPNRTVAQAEEAVFECFRHQAAHYGLYRRYLELLDIDAEQITAIEDIPFLPIEFFKTRKVYASDVAPNIVFTSSGTGGNVSRH